MTERKPRDDGIDVFGVSDRGKVRANNEDHFLLAVGASTRATFVDTNLSETRSPAALDDQRVAFVAMVADGVGGATGGERRAPSRSRLRRGTS